MSQPFGSYPYDASGIDNFSHPIFINANRAPTSNDIYPAGTMWLDNSVSPKVLYDNLGAGDWGIGGNSMATTTDPGIVLIDTTVDAADTDAEVPTAKAVYDYGQSLVLAGANIASEVAQGIAFTASDAQCVGNEPNTLTEAYMVSPDNLIAIFAEPNGPIGGTTPVAGTFTDLTADGSGTVSLGANAASDITVTGAFDLTLASTAGSLVVNAGEAAADAIDLNAASGGFDVDVALLAAITSTRNNAQAILLESTAGGIDILASGSGGAGEDIDIICTGGSVNISGTENAADAVTIAAANGGIDITAGGAAGEDIDISNTSGSVHIVAGEAVADAVNIDSTGGVDVDASGQINLASSQNAADAIVIIASAGGVDITATGSAGEDLDLLASGSSVNITATENAAQAIYVRANGGTSETIDIHADQGTGVASINVHSDVGGVTVASGLASADAINISASDAAGGIDVDAGTAGVIVDTTGAVSLDGAAASNFSVSGAGVDLTLSSSGGRVVVNGEEAAADALRLLSAAGGLDADVALQMSLVSSQAAAADSIKIEASAADGGIDVDAGTGGITIDSTGAVSVDAAAASNFSVSGAGFDLTLASSGGRVLVNGEEAAADALRLLSAAGGLDVDVALQMNLVSSQNAADAIVINASAGGVDITAAGAAGEDIDIVNTAGSVNITSGEAIATSMVLTSAGGLDVAVTGAAGQDIDVTCTSGSMNVTIGENVSDAIVINASGAASGMSLDAGTAGVTIGTGMLHAVTSVATAATPYAVLGTDYFITTDSTGGALEITLPAVPVTGRTLIVYDGAGQAAAGGNVTINGNGVNIAAGGSSAATKVINTAYESYTLTYNGTIWCGQNIV